MRKFTVLYFELILLFLLGCINTSHAQTLQDQLESVISDVLGSKLSLSPGEHGEHFLPANVAASGAVISTLNNFISSSVSSFPLSSTVAGLTFDFSTGRPVSTSTSLGPIFSERAHTMGQGLFNMGINFTYADYNKMRGTNIKDLRLTFTHQNVPDINGPYGDSENEFDYIDMFMNMKITASIFAFYFSYGVTDNFDVGVAVPFVNVHIKSAPLARINSYTFIKNGAANHHFGADSSKPVLETRPTPIDDDATGIGDIAIRAKYNFSKSETADFAAMLEYRLATGEQENFLGAGDSRIKAVLIASKTMGDFTPHLNLAYEIRNSDVQRDRIGVFLGYDQKISESFTLAVDFIGEYELGDQIDAQTFPEPITATTPDGLYSQTVSTTNLPNSNSDNIVNGAFGFKFNPKKSVMVIGNVFFPLNDGGLRADFIPTLGVEFSF
jgi:hypothetical protein